MVKKKGKDEKKKVAIVLIVIAVAGLIFYGWLESDDSTVDEESALTGQAGRQIARNSNDDIAQKSSIFTLEDFENDYGTYDVDIVQRYNFESESDVEEHLEEYLGKSFVYSTGELWESKMSRCTVLCGIAGHDSCLFTKNYVLDTSYAGLYEISSCSGSAKTGIPSADIEEYDCYCS